MQGGGRRKRLEALQRESLQMHGTFRFLFRIGNWNDNLGVSKLATVSRAVQSLPGERHVKSEPPPGFEADICHKKS